MGNAASDRTRRPLDEAGTELPFEAALALLFMPPFLGLLFTPGAGLGEVAGSIVVIAIYTFVVGAVLHFAVDFAARWLRSRGVHGLVPRFLFAELVAAGTCAGITLAVLPLFVALCDGIAAEPVTLLIRGLVVVAIYVAIAFTLGRVKERRRDAEADAAERRQAARVAQLRAEQARTNPHFFRNSLGMVAELIHEDPERAEETLLRLSELFKYALDGYDQRFVSLSEEAEALTAYLAIQTARHGERLAGDVVIPEALRDLRIPPLLLQPLVENAIHHGFGGAALRIVVGARQEADFLVLVVEDDGMKGDGARHRGTGTGLKNVRERLRLAYGEAATLDAAPRTEGGFACTLRIPCGS